MEYSIFDAKKAGFSKVVFVIRKDFEKEFKDRIGSRIEKEIEVGYCFQDIQDLQKDSAAQHQEKNLGEQDMLSLLQKNWLMELSQ